MADGLGVVEGSGGRGFAEGGNCFLGFGVTVVEERGREGNRETGFEADMDEDGSSSFGRERDRDRVRKL